MPTTASSDDDALFARFTFDDEQVFADGVDSRASWACTSKD